MTVNEAVNAINKYESKIIKVDVDCQFDYIDDITVIDVTLTDDWLELNEIFASTLVSSDSEEIESIITEAKEIANKLFETLNEEFGNVELNYNNL